MASLQKIVNVLERIEKNQQIAIKQKILNSDIKLWADYGKELHEIKESEVADVAASKRHEESAVFMIRGLLLKYDMRPQFSEEDWKNFMLAALFWMTRPAMKKLWQDSRKWFPKPHQEFIDGLIK